MTPRIEKAINIFLDAINNGTLASGTCAACAVGNLVAYELNHKPIIKVNTGIDGQPNMLWYKIVSPKCPITRATKEAAIKQINLTDFTVNEIIEIERVFEINTKIGCLSYFIHNSRDIREDQINGLNAVVKLMLGFDNNIIDKTEEIFTNKALELA